MSKENLSKGVISPELGNFLEQVVQNYIDNSGYVGVEEAAKSLVKKEGMEEFSVIIPKIRRRLKKFLGDGEWQKLKKEESDRILNGDRSNKGATAG